MIIEDIYYLFRNKTLNVLGVERDFLQLLQDKDVNKALQLMTNNEEKVDKALMEYFPDKHAVNNRPNKIRKSQSDYISIKIPRKRQKFINEVALFFLLNNRVKFTLKDKQKNEEYKVFNEFVRSIHFHTLLRQCKRLAGAETQSALLFHIYKKEDNTPECQPLVLSRCKGYDIRTLIDQYNIMRAFAYGYKTKQGNKTVQHWDIQTDKFIINCTHQTVGWNVEILPNPTGKINAVFVEQEKEWEGVQPLCDREEDVMCRLSDNNNYFSDPIAKASADVIDNMTSPETIGKFIQMEGDSVFDYITPPSMAEGWRMEKEDLKSAILNDSFTPDFTYEGIKGYGTLSGAALRNSLVIGYIKRSQNLETWEIAVERMKSIIVSFLRLKYPLLKWDGFDVSVEFTDPFEETQEEKMQMLTTAKSNGIISTRTAVQMMSLVDDVDEELSLIEKEHQSIKQGESKKEEEEEEQ